LKKADSPVKLMLVMIVGVPWPVETWYCIDICVSKYVWTAAESVYKIFFL
jgi:hypothetical protein